MSDDKTGAEKIAQLVKQARLCMLTTMTAEGKHVSRPMALQEVEFDGDLWFFCYDDSDVAQQVRTNPQVNVGFSDPKQAEWTSVSGAAEVVHDRAKAEELWGAPLKVWFPDGLDTPGLSLIKVHAESAEYWESPSSKVVRLVTAAAAAVTGDPGKFAGHNEEVDLT
jgi:general stress protein 26